MNAKFQHIKSFSFSGQKQCRRKDLYTLNVGTFSERQDWRWCHEIQRSVSSVLHFVLDFLQPYFFDCGKSFGLGIIDISRSHRTCCRTAFPASDGVQSIPNLVNPTWTSLRLKYSWTAIVARPATCSHWEWPSAPYTTRVDRCWKENIVQVCTSNS